LSWRSQRASVEAQQGLHHREGDQLRVGDLRSDTGLRPAPADRDAFNRSSTFT
jgi:hypothetical protein